MTDYDRIRTGRHYMYTVAIQKAVDHLEDTFQAIVDRGDVIRKREQLRKAQGDDNYGTVLRELRDMLDSLGIPYDRRRTDYAHYASLIEQADIPDSVEVEKRMLLALYQEYVNYPGPVQYMERIVDRLCTDEDGWNSDPLRVRILKQFLKYGNGLADVVTPEGRNVFGGRKAVISYVNQRGGHASARRISEADLSLLDDGLFGEYLAQCREASGQKLKELKKYRGPYGIIKLADDLASGRVIREEGIKRGLYLFAIVYGMTYDPEASGTGTDGRTASAMLPGTEDAILKDSDIVKNLFYDYYTTNLLRYVCGEGEDGTGAGPEDGKGEDPSGISVNYKNFAEIVYLYYIHQEERGPASSAEGRAERIRRSTEMINRLIRNQGECPPSLYPRENISEELKTGWLGKAILDYSEADFEQYMQNHYLCSTDKAYDMETGKLSSVKNSIGLMKVENDQVTAHKCYLKLMDRLMFLGGTVEIPDLSKAGRKNASSGYALFKDELIYSTVGTEQFVFYQFTVKKRDETRPMSYKKIVGKLKGGRMVPHMNYFRYFDDASYQPDRETGSFGLLLRDDISGKDSDSAIYDYGIWFTDLDMLTSGAAEGEKKAGDGEGGENREGKVTGDSKVTGEGKVNGDGKATGEGKVTVKSNVTGQADREQFARFVSVLRAFSSLLVLPADDEVMPENMTRSKLLTAYYYAFNKDAETSYGKERGRSFREIYADFKAGANTLLEKCNYVPFGERNLFDVLLAFSAYAYVNL